MARTPIIAPSILSADPLAMAASIDRLGASADWLHVDVMDGHYVPNLTYGPALVRALSKRYPAMFLDVHLMVEYADDFLDMFIGAGPSSLVIHAEAARHLHRALCKIKESGIKCGVSINPATSVDMIEPILKMVDIVLVMSVNPGFAAQKFIPECVEKVVRLYRFRSVNGADFLIEIDGGVSAENAGYIASAGCDAFVAGSAIFGADDPASAAERIRSEAAKGMSERV